MSEYKFDKFVPGAFKLMIMVGVDTSDFPGLTEEYMRDAREWLTDDENFEWLLKQREIWSKKPAKPPEDETPIEEEDEEPPAQHDYFFHHTQLDGPDGGVSLVLCDGDSRKFDSVVCGGVTIPHHGTDHGRTSYWNMRETPSGSPDIVAYLDGKEHRYPTKKGKVLFGKCTKK